MVMLFIVVIVMILIIEMILMIEMMDINDLIDFTPTPAYLALKKYWQCVGLAAWWYFPAIESVTMLSKCSKCVTK